MEETTKLAAQESPKQVKITLKISLWSVTSHVGKFSIEVQKSEGFQA